MAFLLSTHNNLPATLNQAAIELGLISAPLADPYASANENIILLRRLFNTVGQKLNRVHPWSSLTWTYSFPTVIGEYLYSADNNAANPPNYPPSRYVAQTGWNTTTKTRLIGPLNPAQWAQIQSQAVTTVSGYYFQTRGTYIELYPTPTAVETLTIAFVTESWIVNVAFWPRESVYWADTDPNPDQYWPAFDPVLMNAALKLAYLRAKGFDSTGAQQDYNEALSLAIAADGAPGVLSMNRTTGLKLISFDNLPDTGFGS
jgi:hypothetical protein